MRQSETELNFELYRQATNKIAGISEVTAAFLETHFEGLAPTRAGSVGDGR